jgi:hypothetical protein
MITLSVTLPEPVAAEFFEAAQMINDQFGKLNHPVDAKALMAFALARHEAKDLCAQFDLALRAVRGIDVPDAIPNPVLP